MTEEKKPARPAPKKKNNRQPSHTSRSAGGPTRRDARPPVGQGRRQFQAARRQRLDNLATSGSDKTVQSAARPSAPPPIEELPDFTPPEYIQIARIGSPFGLRGAVKAAIQTDFPDRFEELEKVFLSHPGSGEWVAYTLLSARLQNEKQLVLRFAGITKIEQAKELVDCIVAIPVGEVVELPEDEYYIFQIVGLEVYTTEGEYVGRVVNVEQLPANDIYSVRGPLSKKDILIPAIKDVVKKIDLEAGRITIEMLEGLI